MTYIAAQARQELLDEVARAIDDLGLALADLGAAYEQLDDATGDRLEEALFRPVQIAYGRAQRTYSGFAQRSGLDVRRFEPGEAGLPSNGVKGFLERAVHAVGSADAALSTLQDSMMPVEVGDAELRAGLAEVRMLIGDLPARSAQFVRVLGR